MRAQAILIGTMGVAMLALVLVACQPPTMDGNDDPSAGIPSGLSLERAGFNAVRVTWTSDEPDTSGFEIERDGSIVGSVGSESRSYTDAGLAIDSAPRSYRVRGVRSDGPGEWSSSQTIVVDLGEQKATSEDGAASDRFGWSVAISGDTAVVGAPYDDAGIGVRAGAAYVFERTAGTWSQVAKLTPSNGASNSDFGHSVDVHGDTIIVGAPLRDRPSLVDAGFAYVFVRPSGGWTDADEDALLSADAPAIEDNFGWSVAISETVAVIGAPQQDPGSVMNAGSAYVFVRPTDGWASASEDSRIGASDGDAGHRFGSSVAVDGSEIVVGAENAGPAGTNRGAVYVFSGSGSTWNQDATLTAADADDSDTLGSSVAISGNTIVAGARGDSGAGSSEGSAYVFVEPAGGWEDSTQTAKLTASDPESAKVLGTSVAISGSVVLVGAEGDSVLESVAGAVYVFLQPDAGWSDATEDHKINASDVQSGDFFSRGLAIDGASALVGAYNEDELGSNAGAAYFYGWN